MSLSREQAESEYGLAFIREDDRSPADPDQPIFEADITLDGHTVTFAGKSEDEIVEQAERFLLGRGRIQRPEDEVADAGKLDSQPGPGEPVHVPLDEDAPSVVHDSSEAVEADVSDDVFANSEDGVEVKQGDAATDDSDVHDDRNANDDPEEQ